MAYIGKNPKFNSSTYTPQSTEPSTPTEGMVYYDDGTNRAEGLYVYENGVWTPVGSGSAGINYILNPDAESGTTDWATYADAAGAAPVDGTGGSANITFTDTTSTPLRGAASFLITKDAANRQGEGVSYDFTIDEADKAKVLRISFDYDSSTDYADGDIRVYVYDVTNSNLIQVVDRDLPGNNFGTYAGEFQTAADSTSYRLILHISSTNASAYTVKLDNIQVGPRTSVLQNTVVKVEGEGNGGSAFTSGVTNIPFTETQDTTDSWDGTTFTAPESGDYNFTGSIRWTNGVSQPGIFLWKNGSLYRLAGQDNGSNVVLCPFSATITLEKGDSITIRTNGVSDTLQNVASNHWIHIQKLNTAPGNSGFANRQVIVEARGASGVAITGGSSNIEFTEVTDTTSSWDGTTFTAPESGLYSFVGDAFFTTSQTRTIDIYKNGTVFARGGDFNNEFAHHFASAFELEKGDTVNIRLATGNSGTTSNTAYLHYLTIFKLQSSQTLIGSETVAAKYNSNSGQSIPNTTDTVVNFEDKVIDTHGAVTTGSSWVFTAPVSGIYKCSAQAYTGVGNNWDVNESLFVKIRKNSVDDTLGTDYVDSSDNTGRRLGASVDTLLELSKGDTVDVVVFHSYGSSVALDSGPQYISFSIHKI